LEATATPTTGSEDPKVSGGGGTGASELPERSTARVKGGRDGGPKAFTRHPHLTSGRPFGPAGRLLELPPRSEEPGDNPERPAPGSAGGSVECPSLQPELRRAREPKAEPPRAPGSSCAGGALGARGSEESRDERQNLRRSSLARQRTALPWGFLPLRRLRTGAATCAGVASPGYATPPGFLNLLTS
jgi:hypothetical protein